MESSSPNISNGGFLQTVGIPALFLFIAGLIMSSGLYKQGVVSPEWILQFGSVIAAISVSVVVITYFVNISDLPKGGSLSLFVAILFLWIWSISNTVAYAKISSTASAAGFLPLMIGAAAIAMFMMFSGSLMEPSGSYFYVGALLLVILYAMIILFFTGSSVFTTPSPPLPPSSPYHATTPNRSVYDMDRQAQETSAHNRSLVDLTYLTVAYPTLGPNDRIPIPNTTEVQGHHSIANYQDILNKGATSLYLDIYFQDSGVALANGSNASKETINTWRVGTLNTSTGLLQNKRTISLSSVLSATQRSIETHTSSDIGRTYFIILNPRYTTTQIKNGLARPESILARTIQETVRSCGLPPISKTEMSSSSSGLSGVRLNQAKNQVIFILGGPRQPSSTVLRDTIQGTVDLQNVFLRNTGSSPAAPETALAYTPGVSKIPFDSPTVLCSNIGNADSILVSQNRSKESVANGTADMPKLVLIFPDDNDGKTQLYEDANLPHIRFGASFPVVYPASLTAGYSANRNILNGYSYERTPGKHQIRSFVWDNTLNADATPNAESFLSVIQYCGNTSSKPVNPILNGMAAASSIWGDIMEKDIPAKNWCKDIENYSSMIHLVRPLILYHPPSVVRNANSYRKKHNVKTEIDISGKTPVPGYTPKPAVVDYWGPTGRQGVYILRSIVTHGNVEAERLR